MWRVTIANTSFSKNLNLFNSSNLNIKLPFFRSSTRLVGSSITNPLPIIQDSTTSLEPINLGFLIKVEGLWQVLTYTQKLSISNLALNSYFWRGDFTYILTDSILTPINLAQEFAGNVNNLLDFGQFDYSVIDVKVGGVSVNFNQVGGRVIPQFNANDPCRPRLGSTLKITYLKTLIPSEVTYQKVSIFDKTNLQVRTVTLYNYRGSNYYISNTLESFTLLNLTNKKFLIIQP